MSKAVAEAEVIFAIEGMHCAACVRRVSQALERGGARVEEVRLGEARVRGSLENTPALVAALEKAGFSARVLA